MNESDRLLAAGIPLVLKDGREVRLRYGMRGLKQIEDEFGSVAAIQKRLVVDDGIASGKAIGTVWILLSIGLMREGLSEDELDELLDPAELTRYVEAIGLAFTQAFPAGRAEGNVQASRGGFPGPTATGSPPSPLGEATSTSGR